MSLQHEHDNHCRLIASYFYPHHIRGLTLLRLVGVSHSAIAQVLLMAWDIIKLVVWFAIDTAKGISHVGPRLVDGFSIRQVCHPIAPGCNQLHASLCMRAK
jgi:hypothetical protein